MLTRVDGERTAVGRPYVICSCAMSLDGRIDDCSDARLILSGPADLDRVDEVRAGCDAILVGAATVRRDNPRLAVRAEHRRAARVAAGLPPTPVKVVLSGGGDLDPRSRLFGTDPVDTLVYRRAGSAAPPPSWSVAPPGAAIDHTRVLPAPIADGAAGAGGPGPGGRVSVVDLPGRPRVDVAEIDVAEMLADLAHRGVRRLLVEGGTSVHTAFLTAGLVDELHLAVAPFFVGERDAPAFVGPGAFPQNVHSPLRLAEVRQLDDVVLLRYLVPTSA
ncbi:pyrimidine reductase, riboflavin biosynthesis [Frankia torreyi]|uniref:Pyrimidine reductase, riboflavin biosynthesis n=1 Tax=Frankia torreyi TaxID=1856 RepID=A0A0D8BMY8_9ACTN|nr:MULTISPECIES: dihydrofolate reductase family protein [Frankia]KJE25460.1 pyrimidine reductase, riboflavin biosynthesis [Frankia torreyi]KQC38565.1 deaminase [Frankia sp. ACN1ag]KQM04820.1 pyrimidine reductase, riboflavin biosynthesis [Frankia sp. CpI1-P]